MDVTQVASIGAIGFAMFVGHSFGDHWMQTGAQAANKGRHDHEGRAYCLRHVASLTATKLVLILAVVVLTGLPLNPLALVAGLAVDGATHYWCDRRFTLEELCRRLARFGKADFYALGKDSVHQVMPSGSHLGTGAYALDQSFHHLCLFVATLIITL